MNNRRNISISLNQLIWLACLLSSFKVSAATEYEFFNNPDGSRTAVALIKNENLGSIAAIATVHNSTVDTRFDSDSDGVFDLIRIDHTDLQLTFSKITGRHYSQLDVIRYSAGSKLQARFQYNQRSRLYELHSFSRTPIETFFSGQTSPDPSCEAGKLTQLANLNANSYDILRVSMVSASKNDTEKDCGSLRETLLSALKKVAQPPDGSLKYSACLQKTDAANLLSLSMKVDQAVRPLLASTSNKLQCRDDLPNGTNASYTENQGIAFRLSWLKNATPTQIEDATFHELLHKHIALLDDSTSPIGNDPLTSKAEKHHKIIADIKACCDTGYSEEKDSCKSLTVKTGSFQDTPTARTNWSATISLKLDDANTSQPADSSKGGTATDQTFRKVDVSDRKQMKRLAQEIPSASQQLSAEGRKALVALDENIIKKIEPSLISRAQAAEPSTFTAPAQASNYSPPSGETTRSSNNSVPRERDSSGSTGRTSSYSGGSGSSVSSPEPITGTANTFNKNGTPKTLKLSNGMEVPSMTAFANVRPDAISLAANAEKSGSSYSPPTVDTSAYTSTTNPTSSKTDAASIDGGNGKAAGRGANPSNSTYGGGSGGSGPGAGGPSDISGGSPSTGGNSAPSTGGTQSVTKETPPENPDAAYASLKSVPVRDMRDVATILRSTNTPGDLLKQKWFSKKLDWIGIQIVDHENVGYGSVKPKTRRTLDSILNPGAQRSPSSRGGK